MKDLMDWMEGYQTYLQAHGYTDPSIRGRLRYLGCFARFVLESPLTDLEEFSSSHMVEFID